MARYYWDILTLQRESNRLLKMMENEQNPERRNYLSFCYDVVNGTIFFEFAMPDKKPRFKDQVIDMFHSYLIDQRYFELLDVFTSIMDSNMTSFDKCCDNLALLDSEVTKVSSVHVGREKAISLCHDYFRDLDEELYDIFKRFYDERYSHLRFTKHISTNAYDLTCGRTHFLYGINKAFINVLGQNNPNMVMTLIHEGSHAIDSMSNPDAYLKESFFFEVISLFNELVAGYRRVGNFDELFYYSYQIKRLSSFNEDANTCTDIGTLLELFKDCDFKTDKNFYEVAKIRYKFSKTEIRKTLNQGSYDDVVYPLSFMLAMYFFSIFKQDNRRGLTELKKFISIADRDVYMPLIMSNELGSVVKEEIHNTIKSSNDFFEQKRKVLML